MTPLHRNRVGWWIYVAVLTGVALFVAHAFVGVLVLGLFGYYSTRPICDRFSAILGSGRLAAMLTILTVLVPVFSLVYYAGLKIAHRIHLWADASVVARLASRVGGLETITGNRASDSAVLLRNPPSLGQLSSPSFWSGLEQGVRVLDAVFGTILLIVLAVTLAYALLEHDESLSNVFATLVGGRNTTAYTYALAVDDDLESVFFGNLLFAVVMSVVATATYAATNLVSPSGMAVPMVFTLGFLTGVSSLIPVVVGKVVYLPVVGYLGFEAAGRGSGFAFVGGVLLVYVFVLDLLPQSFIQPYLSGRQLDTVLLLFAYVLGPILFGWYGFFLMPIVFVLILEAVRIVLPELLHGEPIVPEANVAEDTGADTRAVRTDDADQD